MLLKLPTRKLSSKFIGLHVSPRMRDTPALLAAHIITLLVSLFTSSVENRTLSDRNVVRVLRKMIQKRSILARWSVHFIDKFEHIQAEPESVKLTLISALHWAGI